MISIGEYNVLKATRRTDNGMYLTDEEMIQEVLLPNKYVPDDLLIDEEINVFIFKDSEDRLTATTAEPKIKLHEFACLQVREVNNVGAFLDWGLEKDLMVPFKEQPGKMLVGHWYMVYLYLDEDTDRLVASGRYNRFLEKEGVDVKEGEEVDVLIDNPTELGVNVIINNRFRGLIYHNELFQNVRRGDRLKGYIKLVREDNKIDLTLQKPGYGKVEPNAEKILALLKSGHGYLNLIDKSDPELIYERLGISKKTFKKVVGALYKQRRIRLEDDGIYLNE